MIMYLPAGAGEWWSIPSLHSNEQIPGQAAYEALEFQHHQSGAGLGGGETGVANNFVHVFLLERQAGEKLLLFAGQR